MKIYHGLLIFGLLLQLVARTSGFVFDLGKLFSGKSSDNDNEPSLLGNVLSSVVAGINTVTTGVKEIVKEPPSFGFGKLFSGKSSNNDDKPSLLDNALSSVVAGINTVTTGIKEVAKESPSFINKAKQLFISQSEESSEIDVRGSKPPEKGYFQEYWTSFKDKVKHAGDFIGDSNDEFVDHVKSFRPSRTGWFSSTPVEECTAEWTSSNMLELEQRMKTLLYGQNIVVDHIADIIRHHWYDDTHHDKALVLSMHGSTGVGKNYVSKFIVQSLFKLGEQSKFISLYSGRIDFTEEAKVAKYQEQLKNELVEKVSACDRHVFIFDEVDKIPSGMLDVLKPFIDYNMKVRGKDFRKATFIFLSNIAQGQINEHYMHLWHQGILREDLKYMHFEKVLRDAVYNNFGGLRHSDNIKHQLVDYYIPFLPLEEEHVKLCIKYAFENNHNITPTDEEIEAVHDYVDYGPEDNPMFSKTGCKAISSKVALIASQRRYKTKSSKEL